MMTSFGKKVAGILIKSIIITIARTPYRMWRVFWFAVILMISKMYK